MKWSDLFAECLFLGMIGAVVAFATHPTLARAAIGGAIGSFAGVLRYYHLKHRKDEN